ncbi:hypothetical protein KC901_01620 [Patescibacteria group bacterium]|nr:hypothetical protein [Patescibacteria group bacterium]
MKKIIHVSVALLAVFVIGFSAVSVSALESHNELEARITELRAVHADLKAQVEAGDITIEEAREQWHALIAELRAEKDAFFEKKRAQIEDRYETLAERNPERAEILKEHIDAMLTRHQERVEERAELRAKVEVGEITRKEAREMKVDFVKDQHEKYQTIREDLRDKRQDLRDERMEDRKENRDEYQLPPFRPATGSTRPVEVNPLGVRGAFQVGVDAE